MITVTDYISEVMKKPIIQDKNLEELNHLLQLPVKDIIHYYLGENLLSDTIVLTQTTTIEQILMRAALEAISQNGIPLFMHKLTKEEKEQFSPYCGIKLIGSNPNVQPIYLLAIPASPMELYKNRQYAYQISNMYISGGDLPLNAYCNTVNYVLFKRQEEFFTKQRLLPCLTTKNSPEKALESIQAHKKWLEEFEKEMMFLERYSHIPPIFVGDEIEVYLHGSDHPPTKTIVEKIMIEQEGIFLYHKDELNKMRYTHLKTYGYHWNKVDVLQEESLNTSPIVR